MWRLLQKNAATFVLLRWIGKEARLVEYITGKIEQKGFVTVITDEEVISGCVKRRSQYLRYLASQPVYADIQRLVLILRNDDPGESNLNHRMGCYIHHRVFKTPVNTMKFLLSVEDK